MTSPELPEPIVLTLTPLNAHFTVCLAPKIIPVEEGAKDAQTYPWCESTLNTYEEY
jgi:hypothetical protein